MLDGDDKHLRPAPISLIGATVASVAVLVMFALLASGTTAPTLPAVSQSPPSAGAVEPVVASALDDGHGGQRVAITVSASGFVPERISARAGESLVIDLVTQDGRVADVAFSPSGTVAHVSGKRVTVRIPAMGPGLYTFTERDSGMHGRLIVR